MKRINVCPICEKVAIITEIEISTAWIEEDKTKIVMINNERVKIVSEKCDDCKKSLEEQKNSMMSDGKIFIQKYVTDCKRFTDSIEYKLTDLGSPFTMEHFEYYDNPTFTLFKYKKNDKIVCTLEMNFGVEDEYYEYFFNRDITLNMVKSVVEVIKKYKDNCSVRDLLQKIWNFEI
jgi:hypothetical protein